MKSVASRDGGINTADPRMETKCSRSRSGVSLVVQRGSGCEYFVFLSGFVLFRKFR